MHGAQRLPCSESGELQALRYVLGKTSSSSEQLVIFDVGASIGDYTRMCVDELKRSQRTYQLFAFEPTQFSFADLLRTFIDNKNVHPMHCGLGSQQGETVMYLPWARSAAASAILGVVDLWADQQYSQNMQTETVAIDTVDGVMEQGGIKRIDFLKLDVEGMELDALKGAQKALAAGAIKFIQIEISAASLKNKVSLLDFWTLLHEKYRCFLIMHAGLQEIAKYDLHLENFSGATNYLFELR